MKLITKIVRNIKLSITAGKQRSLNTSESPAEPQDQTDQWETAVQNRLEPYRQELRVLCTQNSETYIVKWRVISDSTTQNELHNFHFSESSQYQHTMLSDRFRNQFSSSWLMNFKSLLCLFIWQRRTGAANFCLNGDYISIIVLETHNRSWNAGILNASISHPPDIQMQHISGDLKITHTFWPMQQTSYFYNFWYQKW